MEPKKVIIKTDKHYSDAHKPLLQTLYKRKIELFCVWGKYCSEWEDAMDNYIIDIKRLDKTHHITTSSHDGEPFEDVISMVELWSVEGGCANVEIIEL